MAEVRQFSTGATRDVDTNKHDYEGFLSPLAVERFGEYMTKHRIQPDGKVRDSDNWQKGIPLTAYMKSLWRHVMDLWKQHRGHPGQDSLEDSICAIIFNAQGYLHEVVKERKSKVPLALTNTPTVTGITAFESVSAFGRTYPVADTL